MTKLNIDKLWRDRNPMTKLNIDKLWRDRNPITKLNIDAKALLNQKNILRAKRITAAEIDGIIGNIRLKIGDDTDDYTNGVNGNKMDTNVIEHQKRDQESKNTGFGKAENNKC